MFVIVHSGQTGVERGAHHGALAAGFRIAGFMSARRRDELGPLPEDVAQHLMPSPAVGPRAAIRSNLGLADAVMIVVPDVQTAGQFPAMDWIMREVRTRQLHHIICDSGTTVQHLAGWAGAIPDQRRVVVTGPRATRWQPGEDVARRLVRSLAML